MGRFASDRIALSKSPLRPWPKARRMPGCFKPRRPLLLFTMHMTFALFADAANVSQEGKLNILGVFDALQVSTLPSLHPRATLVVHLKGSPSDAGAHRVTL